MRRRVGSARALAILASSVVFMAGVNIIFDAGLGVPGQDFKDDPQFSAQLFISIVIKMSECRERRSRKAVPGDASGSRRRTYEETGRKSSGGHRGQQRNRSLDRETLCRRGRQGCDFWTRSEDA